MSMDTIHHAPDLIHASCNDPIDAADGEQNFTGRLNDVTCADCLEAIGLDWAADEIREED